MKKRKNNCKLCNKIAVLEESHVIPKFVYSWVKKTSGTGYLRFGETPNLRVQDGIKKYWLCPECEDTLSHWENEFSKKIFYPYINNRSQIFEYDSWLLKFSVSLSWRVLQLYKEIAPFKHFSPKLILEVEKALKHWGNYMLGKVSNPGKYEQHILPLDFIESYTGNMPTNINRYIARSIDTDIACNSKQAFVYVKLPYILNIGFIELSNKNHWRNTKIKTKKGILGTSKYVIPKVFGEYLIDRANKAKVVYDKISEKQKNKIEKTYKKNIEKLGKSKTFEAMTADVRLFGEDTFK